MNWENEVGPIASSQSGLPSYKELPVRKGSPAGSSWGMWGDNDRFGCLNLLTPQRAAAAAALVKRGATFALNADLTIPNPPLFNRQPFTHEVSGVDDGPSHDDILHNWNTQGSSQWDGFRHIRHPLYGWYGGASEGFHGVDAWAERGLAGRAILADVAAWREAQGRALDYTKPDPITGDEILATLNAQNTEAQVGDMLLIRTGWLGWYKRLDQAQRDQMGASHTNPGLHPEERTAEVLWDLHVAAVAADNPSLEAWPPGAAYNVEQINEIRKRPSASVELFIHQRILPLLGIPIGELFELDALAQDCAETGSYEGLFTSAPLNLRRGVASPPNALVIR